jgi:hypothetical protein
LGFGGGRGSFDGNDFLFFFESVMSGNRTSMITRQKHTAELHIMIDQAITPVENVNKVNDVLDLSWSYVLTGSRCMFD